MRTRLLASLLTLVATSLAPAAPAPAAAVQRPNVVYIMADELGYFEPGYAGNPHLVTPNIDRIATEGVRFTQGMAGSAVCAPTRCCFLTGKHSGHT
ncbi:MAG: sulfatase-like hydrolase/transferase, partial [Opitutaceae bacterium]